MLMTSVLIILFPKPSANNLELEQPIYTKGSQNWSFPQGVQDKQELKRDLEKLILSSQVVSGIL